jgi:hypothetical protein
LIRSRTAFGLLAAGLVLIGPELAHAHAFSRSSMLASFMEGVTLPVIAPTILLCILPLGLLVGLGGHTRIAPILLAFLAGVIVAVPVASYVGPFIEPIAVLLGAIFAALAALLPKLPGRIVAILAATGGLVGCLSALTGHAWGEVPLPTLPGLLLGFFIVMAVSAGAVIRTRQYAGGPAAMLAWRIGASWCGAVALIYAAFESRAYF